MTIAVLDKEDHVRAGDHRRSNGRAWRTVSVDVVDPVGCSPPPGELGEVVVGGLHLMSGYRGLPEQTSAVLRGGRVWTRDMGYLDEAGYLYLRGRTDEMINSGGFNIAPREIEEVVVKHVAVQDCVAMGVPADRWGDTVLAFVTLQPGHSTTEDEVIEFTRERLGFRRPRTVVFLDDLPRNAYGKIDRSELKRSLPTGGLD